MTNNHISDQLNHWIPFEGRPYGRRAKIRVSLDKRRCVYLNHATWVALCEPKAVEFLFNPVLQAVGMRKADPEMESSFPVTPHKIPKGKLSYRISAAAFFNNLDIKIQRTFQFNKIVLDRNGMISMRIDSVTVVTRGAR